MKLNPQQAPLYGQCVITVQLADEELAAEEQGVDYFLLFAGSTQRHLTSTLRSSHDTLQALCPAHDCCEVVLVTLCSVSQGVPDSAEDLKPCQGHVTPLSEQRFNFVQDLAFDMAQFLVSTAGRPHGLDGALLLDECQIPLQECERLDESLALALRHLVLPPGWSLLGNKLSNSLDLNPQETLLHFSARRGLLRVTRFLLRQSGAREALQLTNSQGHTPSAIAASRGHERLHELLTKADLDTDKVSESVQLVSSDAWVVCHLPSLNTHTLTLRIHPGHEPPTLEETVEQLLHLIYHLHAKGVSLLELHFDALHTAAECCDGVETEITCLKHIQLPATQCLGSEKNWVEKWPVESCSVVERGHGETGNPVKEQSLSMSTPTNKVHPQEHGFNPPEERVCLSSNTGRDYCQTEEEAMEPPAVSTQGLSLCDSSEEARSETEGTDLTEGILPPAVCGKQAEETDREEAVIWEGQEATKGENRSEQEADESTAKEEETYPESAVLTPSGDTKALVMGQTSSSEGSEISDASGSEMKDCSQEGENVMKEDMNLCQELCGELSLDKENAESEGLTPGALSNPLPIDSGDVIEDRGPALPHLLIEGLHEGEPLPDINSLEQNQETAGRDYTTEQEKSLATEPGCHSEDWTETASHKELDDEGMTELSGYNIDKSDNTADFQTTSNSMEDTQIDQVIGDSSAQILRSSGIADTGQKSVMAHSLSSDDDGSFKSVGSSTTEIFNPTQDNVSEEDQFNIAAADGFPEGFRAEQLNGAKSDECSKHSVVGDAEFSAELDAVGVFMDCYQTGSKLESQLLPTPQTMKGLNPELCEWDQSLGLALSESEDASTLVAYESESGHNSAPEIEHSASEVISSFVSESCTSVVDDNKVTDQVRDNQFSETVMGTSTGLSGDGLIVLQQEIQDSLDTTTDEGPPAEGYSENQIGDSSMQIVASLSEPPSPDAEEFSEPTENEIQNPKTPDTVDGASESHNEVEVIKSDDNLIGAGEEENGPEEETDFSTIHRDTEASFHQPCSTLHSGSSQPSGFACLPGRISSTTSCPPIAHSDSGSDIESFVSAEPGYDNIFTKNDEQVTGGDSASEVSVSCSSTDDTASVGPSSSSPEGSQGLGCGWSAEEGLQTGATTTAGLESGGGAGEVEEEAKDSVAEVPRRSCLLRNSIRSLSPLRRHSWGPGKNNGGDAEMNQRSSIYSSAEGKPTLHRRSYSLEGLSGGLRELRGPSTQGPQILEPIRMQRHDCDDRGSLISLTEEQEGLVEHGRHCDLKSRRYRPLRSCPPLTLPLTKSVSMLAISQRDTDAISRLRRKRRISFSFSLSPILTKSKSQFIYGDSSSSDDEDILSTRSFSSASGSLAYSISEEEPGPLRSDTEGKSVTKVSRTFSYLKNKMYKKNKEKEREKREKDKEGKEKDKKTVNGHVFASVSSGQAAQCSQCNKTFNNKEAYQCTLCNASVHKSCRDTLPVCAKVKMKLPKHQFVVPDSSSFPTVTMRNKSGGTRERPWSAILCPEDHSSLVTPLPRRHTSIMAFHGNNLSKSLSISNIAGPVFDEMPIKGLRYLSQSTDSLNRSNQVTESMESLTDEGTEMMDAQLMGEFESEAKDLEADSWSLCVEPQYLQQLDRELVKRQDVIYELMQTEMHHIRTLRIMSEVYSKGLQKELQLDQQTLEKLFPTLDDLLDLHTQNLLRLLERKRECQLEGANLEGGFIINRIGDLLVRQFSGSIGESMKRVYGRFCSRHNEAVNFYKDLLTKDKRFKAFIKKKMSCSIVRRLGIPECILLVTQRITKYPVLIQRILQHTKESEEDYDDLTDAVRLVKEVIAAVDNRVNEHEKKRRLKDFYSRMDSKSVIKGGQTFGREDLLRRRLIHDGALQLKSSQGRLKDVHALLLSDVFVFLQEKDQKYVFAMLDQRSTVISLQKLIVREVANEERGLFLITAGIQNPEMTEVLASSKEDRNNWMQLIQEAMQSMEKDEDEGIPSETEDDKKQLETKAKEMRDLLKQKDTEIMSLLEEKVRLFRGMWEGLNTGEEACRQAEPYFRSACTIDVPRGASIMKDALEEVETLQALVNGSLGGAMAGIQEGGGVGPVCLPRRAETFGGFDSHQMHCSKSGDRDESEDTMGDLRRTESDSVLKKGGNANLLLLLLKRNSEQVLHSVSNLHLLLSTLQAVVVQQDSFIEDQRQALSERSSSCASLSRPSSRPSSLIEQEKQRSLEKQRQELASLQRQQAAHAEEKRRREKDWELREQQLTERELLVHVQEEEILKQQKDLEEEKHRLQIRKEEYQKDLERLRDAQRKLERDREAVQRQFNKMEELRSDERTSSTTSDESQFPGTSHSLELAPPGFPAPSSSLPQRSKPRGKGLNPFTSSSTNTSVKASDTNNQISKSLLQLAKSKSKEGKDKKKKKGKSGSAQPSALPDPHHLPEPPVDGEIFFC